MIFERFCKLKGIDKERKKALNSDQKKEYVFILLFLYCPKVIVENERNMVKGLRKAITQNLGLYAPTGISNIVSAVYVWFTTYKENLDMANTSYEHISKYLVEKGILEKYLPLMC